MIFFCETQLPASVSQTLQPYPLQPNQEGSSADSRTAPPAANTVLSYTIQPLFCHRQLSPSGLQVWTCTLLPFFPHGGCGLRCPSKKETYFGFKVHALITLEGYISAFKITPASVDDREGLRDFAENYLNLVIPGDKGYTGEALSADMQNKRICLMSFKPSNHKKNWLKEIRRLIFRFRRRVETVFPQLSEQLNAERVLAKSFRGLCTRLQNKVLGHNLCMAFNSIFVDSCDIGKIKQLIF